MGRISQQGAIQVLYSRGTRTRIKDKKKRSNSRKNEKSVEQLKEGDSEEKNRHSGGGTDVKERKNQPRTG